jgi:hypothetical protein
MKKLFSISLGPWARILAEAQPAVSVAQATYRTHPNEDISFMNTTTSSCSDTKTSFKLILTFFHQLF